MKRRAGIIQVTVDGVRFDAKGNWEYNLGRPVRETIVGSDGVHGFMEKPQAAFIAGEITDSASLSLEALVGIEEATVVLQLAVGPNGPAKAIVLNGAHFVGEGTGNSEEGNIEVRFEAADGKEIAP
jgi:hypothetical protein